MKSKLFKNYFLAVVVCASAILFIGGCKKDKLVVNQTKQYRQLGHMPANAYDGGWNLILRPDGAADVIPGGDIAYRGTYKVSGSKIRVNTSQNSGSYTFEIISETEIRERDSGVILVLEP